MTDSLYSQLDALAREGTDPPLDLARLHARARDSRRHGRAKTAAAAACALAVMGAAASAYDVRPGPEETLVPALPARASAAATPPDGPPGVEPWSGRTLPSDTELLVGAEADTPAGAVGEVAPALGQWVLGAYLSETGSRCLAKGAPPAVEGRCANAFESAAAGIHVETVNIRNEAGERLHFGVVPDMVASLYRSDGAESGWIVLHAGPPGLESFRFFLERGRLSRDSSLVAYDRNGDELYRR
jgi:hypothetical protein